MALVEVGQLVFFRMGVPVERLEREVVLVFQLPAGRVRLVFASCNTLPRSLE